MKSTDELLIVSITPPNLERGAPWFLENFASIKNALASNPWWRDNALILEKDLVLKLSEFTRRLVDFGYERAPSVPGKGLYAVHGGIVEVWPVNAEHPYLIEFAGNVVSEVKERVEAEERVKPRIPARGIEKLQPGSYVVHVDHGIGIFRGIASENEFPISNFQFPNKFQIPKSKFYIIEYAPPARGRRPDFLYVPVGQKDRLSPYVGFTTPTVHRLGGTVWFKIKKKAREDAEKLAKALLELYAKRNTSQRPPHPGDKTLEAVLHESFPRAETDDQLKAEEEILRDLEMPKPMDRLLSGDVGFGKTEVALRAALRVAASGKQVAVLSPTTILASQHEKTFKERLGDLPVKTAQLSRLVSPKEEREILKGLADGGIDCVIGTHRLLSSDVVFKNLGLVIIDEEQRFGVKQKERFSEMRSEVDVLSLSATPIPRTLSLALAKFRDISLIGTPPAERLPIQTFVLPYSLGTIRRALEFELSRGGQVYFLHNKIETLESARKKLLQALHPSFQNFDISKCRVVHGRMREKEIVRTMNEFREGKTKILLATTIIENGLDISNANTLIVDDAARLGLAEAHQLRGRIGRGEARAFAYFLYKPHHLTERAAERLEALKEYSELGSGYQIALRDLEIRGAGNILGKEQSGAINKVGLNLYCQMLTEAAEGL